MVGVYLTQGQGGIVFTEEDTYNALPRPSIHEMHKLHHEWAVQYRMKTTDNIVFVNNYGWGWVEFLEAKIAAGIEERIWSNNQQP